MQYQNNRELIVVQQGLITTSPHNLLTAQVHTSITNNNNNYQRDTNSEAIDHW